MNRDERIFTLLAARDEASHERFVYCLVANTAEQEYYKTKDESFLRLQHYCLSKVTEWREKHTQIEKELTKATHRKTLLEWVKSTIKGEK